MGITSFTAYGIMEIEKLIIINYGNWELEWTMFQIKFPWVVGESFSVTIIAL